MRTIRIFAAIAVVVLSVSSCDDFLKTIPGDKVSPELTWKTEEDANRFVTGCYSDWADRYAYFYWDCCSDIGYAQFPWEGFTVIGNGSMSPADYGYSFYDYSTIAKCNTYLANESRITFSSESVRKDLQAQVRAIRAYRYFMMTYLYSADCAGTGDWGRWSTVPLITAPLANSDDAKQPRADMGTMRDFIMSELDTCLLHINDTPSERGRIAKPAVYMMKMRVLQYFMSKCAYTWQDLAEFIGNNLLAGKEVSWNAHKVFTLGMQNDPEIILPLMSASSNSDYSCWEVATMFPNSLGGWSSMVPTFALVDMFPMANGYPITDPSSGYDPQDPFANRDPRLAEFILYNGATLYGRVLDYVHKKLPGGEDGDVDNPDYPVGDNSSKTGFNWRKYVYTENGYPDMWNTDCCPILFRYTEAFLSYAEALNEAVGPTGTIPGSYQRSAYQVIKQIREAAGIGVNLPGGDIYLEQIKNDKDKMREIIHNERAITMCGEGLRRFDLLRWHEYEPFSKPVMTFGVKNPDSRDADVYGDFKIAETRVFHEYNKALPIPQSAIDNNPKLVQNPGYAQ